jgi:nicotinamide mononucleotide transporter
MPEFWQKLIGEVAVFQVFEIVAVVSALVYVILASKGSKWCFLFGLISSAIYVYITFKLNFLFDVGINAYYVIMSFYGWFSWSKQTNSGSVMATRVPAKKLLIYIISGFVVCILLAYFADKFSSAELPYLDAFTTVFAIIATYMVVQRQIENWLIWVVVDSVAAGMYFHKELYFTALLFFIYTIVAIFGYFKWKKLLVIK